MSFSSKIGSVYLSPYNVPISCLLEGAYNNVINPLKADSDVKSSMIVSLSLKTAGQKGLEKFLEQSKIWNRQRTTPPV